MLVEGRFVSEVALLRMRLDGNVAGASPTKRFSTCPGKVELVFEIEHGISERLTYRPLPLTTAAINYAEDRYRKTAEATICSICELMFATGFHKFTVMVNRKVINIKDWKFEPAEFPAEKDCRFADARNPPKFDKANVTGKQPILRYPRPGSFEVSLYDVAKRRHQITYSKYKTHRLPRERMEIWRAILPFIIISAGQANNEKLVNSLAKFGTQNKVPVDLEPKDLEKVSDGSILIAVLLDGLSDLALAAESGDPENMGDAIEAMPNGLRTATVCRVEKQIEVLKSVVNHIEECYATIGGGLVVSGLEEMQEWVRKGEELGLATSSLEKAKEFLNRSYSEEQCQREEPERDRFDITAETFRPATFATLAKRTSRSSRRRSVSHTVMNLAHRYSSGTSGGISIPKTGTHDPLFKFLEESRNVLPGLDGLANCQDSGVLERCLTAFAERLRQVSSGGSSSTTGTNRQYAKKGARSLLYGLYLETLSASAGALPAFNFVADLMQPEEMAIVQGSALKRIDMLSHILGLDPSTDAKTLVHRATMLGDGVLQENGKQHTRKSMVLEALNLDPDSVYTLQAAYDVIAHGERVNVNGVWVEKVEIFKRIFKATHCNSTCQCGASLTDDARFCPHCGTVVASSRNLVITAEVDEAPSSDTLPTAASGQGFVPVRSDHVTSCCGGNPSKQDASPCSPWKSAKYVAVEADDGGAEVAHVPRRVEPSASCAMAQGDTRSPVKRPVEAVFHADTRESGDHCKCVQVVSTRSLGTSAPHQNCDDVGKTDVLLETPLGVAQDVVAAMFAEVLHK